MSGLLSPGFLQSSWAWCTGWLWQNDAFRLSGICGHAFAWSPKVSEGVWARGELCIGSPRLQLPNGTFSSIFFFFLNRLIADVWEILGKITALLEETQILRGQGKADCETGKWVLSFLCCILTLPKLLIAFNRFWHEWFLAFVQIILSSVNLSVCSELKLLLT